MYLHLYHGRKDPAVDMPDWGDAGPTLDSVVHLQWTYSSHYVLFATSEDREAARRETGWEDGPFENSLEMKTAGDMVEVTYNGETWYFGDWCLRANAPGEVANG